MHVDSPTKVRWFGHGTEHIKLKFLSTWGLGYSFNPLGIFSQGSHP